MRGNTVRKPILIVAGVAALLVVGLGVWWIVSLQLAGRVVREGERLNLVVVLDQAADGGDLGIELVSLVPKSAVTFVAIPPDLGALREDGSIASLEAIYRGEGIDGLQRALEILLSIDIDHYAVLLGATFASAIDGVDGLALNVHDRIVYMDRTVDPAIQVDLRPGEQRLEGRVILGLLRGESESESREARQNQVLDAFLRVTLYEGVLAQPMAWTRDAHQSISSDLDVKAFARVVAAVADLGVGGRTMDVVPPGELVEGGEYSLVRVVETQRVMAERIRGLDVLTPDEVSVAVFNGNGVRLLAKQLSEYLEGRGFRIAAIANAEVFTYAGSYVVILTEDAKAAILRDALPHDARIVGPEEFEPHYAALRDLVPEGTDLMLVAGAGMELD